MLQAACAALAEAPQKGQDCAHIRTGYRRLGVEQHIIYFRAAANGIAVRYPHTASAQGRMESLSTSLKKHSPRLPSASSPIIRISGLT
jgi:plasmid stabilization system protein ParE